MNFSLNKPGLYSVNIIQITLMIQIFFILESIQLKDQSFKQNQRFLQRNGSQYFQYYGYEWFPRRPRPVLIKHRKHFVHRTDSKVWPLVSQHPINRTTFWEKRSAEETIDRIEEAVDPDTESDELELDRGVVVNFRKFTVFEDKSKLSKYLLKSCGKSKFIGKRIVNGADAEEGEYPWVVAILKHGDAWCAGSILNEWWIITASHCFMSLMDTKAYIVRVGSNNRNAGTSYKISKLIMHEKFHLDNMFNSDIALLKVVRPIKHFGHGVNSICLPRTLYEEPKTTSMVVAGWGALESGDSDMPVILQAVTLDRISDGSCAKKYQTKSNTIYKSQICTWTKNKDACQGDSGGPAIEIQNSRAVLIGIISYGSKCADNFPGVYTQVSYFLKWIETQLEKDDKEKS